MNDCRNSTKPTKYCASASLATETDKNAKTNKSTKWGEESGKLVFSLEKSFVAFGSGQQKSQKSNEDNVDYVVDLLTKNFAEKSSPY
jgi:hypothetical protein